jgi:hypothetical protein
MVVGVEKLTPVVQPRLEVATYIRHISLDGAHPDTILSKQALFGFEESWLSSLLLPLIFRLRSG